MDNRRHDVKDLGITRKEQNHRARPEGLVSYKGYKGDELASLLFGFGVGIGLAILFAPQSGEQTREWISSNAEDKYRQFRRRGRRLVFEAQDLLDRGEHSFTRALRTGRNALDSVAEKLG
jgi:gas vesicle protein